MRSGKIQWDLILTQLSALSVIQNQISPLGLSAYLSPLSHLRVPGRILMPSTKPEQTNLSAIQHSRPRLHSISSWFRKSSRKSNDSDPERSPDASSGSAPHSTSQPARFAVSNRTALNGLQLVLQTLDAVSQSIPFPGVSLPIGAILGLVNGIQASAKSSSWNERASLAYGIIVYQRQRLKMHEV